MVYVFKEWIKDPYTIMQSAGSLNKFLLTLGHQLQQLPVLRESTVWVPSCCQAAMGRTLIPFHKNTRGRSAPQEWSSTTEYCARRASFGNSLHASWKITSPVGPFGEEVPTTGDRQTKQWNSYRHPNHSGQSKGVRFGSAGAWPVVLRDMGL